MSDYTPEERERLMRNCANCLHASNSAQDKEPPQMGWARCALTGEDETWWPRCDRWEIWAGGDDA